MMIYRHPQLDLILAELRAELHALYGDRLARLVLYGSQARGDAEEESDIDVLIVLKGEYDDREESSRVSQLLCQLSLKHDTVISELFASEDRFLKEQSPIMLNVRREGMVIT